MADERKYYVMCEDKCLFEGMTKEQILDAIAQATGNTVPDVDGAFITKIKEVNKGEPLQFWVGTQAEYNTQSKTLADNVFCIITDDTTADDINDAIKMLQQKDLEQVQKIEEINNKLITHNEEIEAIRGNLNGLHEDLSYTTETRYSGVLYGETEGGTQFVAGNYCQSKDNVVNLYIDVEDLIIGTFKTTIYLKTWLRPVKDIYGVVNCFDNTSGKLSVKAVPIKIRSDGYIEFPTYDFDAGMTYTGVVTYVAE